MPRWWHVPRLLTGGVALPLRLTARRPDPGTDGGSPRGDGEASMPIEWDADARPLHLHNAAISLVLRVLENGALGQLHLGTPLAPGRSDAHLGRRPSTASTTGSRTRPALNDVPTR
jgi:hypothetical protein